jgi:hypothetical protein
MWHSDILGGFTRGGGRSSPLACRAGAILPPPSELYSCVRVALIHIYLARGAHSSLQGLDAYRRGKKKLVIPWRRGVALVERTFVNFEKIKMLLLVDIKSCIKSSVEPVSCAYAAL